MRTVQYHLSKVPAKLGISSRSQLDRVLPRRPDPGQLFSRSAAHDWPLALCAGGYERGPAGLIIAGMQPFIGDLPDR